MNHAVVNEDPNARIIRELRAEIDALKEMLLKERQPGNAWPAWQPGSRLAQCSDGAAVRFVRRLSPEALAKPWGPVAATADGGGNGGARHPHEELSH